ncbi:Gfo/Idh/MocA family protein [Paenibacillus humicola]|uniref:Gfo/Idh/MocA family protein n=1 Tax=Paenibacillus humicola TaxID=3110540 RepID=UPI00237B955A|nr:Gfo/Idh/MocA family oxidoreductase [Paenibacillus humicola]
MIEAALIGAGGRGMFAYGTYAEKRPHEIRFIAVCEPNEERRNLFAKKHGIAPDMQFSSWEQLLERPKLCDALLICTQDRDHYRPTMLALEKGYHIMVEKPMSPDPLEALRMAEEAERRNRILKVCHGNRYSTFYGTVKQLLDQRVIGKVMTVQWTENVGFWHHAHSFVRGNWRNSQETSSMLLQKSCHDMDILQWLLGGNVVQVSSFGSLSYFTAQNAPEGSTDRCTSGCAVEHVCPYSAVKLYLNEEDEWPQRVVSLDPSLDARLKALQEGPYGRCVFHCDNDVVDHQVVNLVFDHDVTVSFTMSAFTSEISRTFKIMGSTGEICGHSLKNEIIINHFSGKREVIRPESVEGGHGGADTLIMMDFVKQVKENRLHSVTSGMESARSHLIVFAAEQSRMTGKTVEFDDYIAGLKRNA